MLTAFTLWRQRGGVTHELKDWNFESPVLTTGGQAGTGKGDDTLVGGVTARVDAAADFHGPLPGSAADRVELFDAGGVRRFVGWARTPRPECAVPGEGFRHTFEGPSRFLRSDYLMQANVLDATLHTYSDILSAEILLGLQNGLDGSLLPTYDRVTASAQIDAILSFAKSTGLAGGAAPFDYDLTGLLNELLPLISKQTASCLTCLDSIFSILTNVGMWWDYATNAAGHPAAQGDNPVLRFVTTDTINLATGAVISPPTQTGGGSPATHTIPNDGTVLQSFTPEPQDARLVGTLTVLFAAASASTDLGAVGNGRPVIYTTFTSTVDNGSQLVKMLTLQGQDAVWNGTAFVNPETAPTVNIARLLHMGFDRVWWQFAASTGPQSALHWEWQPGDLLNISSAGENLASAYAQIQQITRNLYTGDERLATGAPTQRGTGQLAALRSIIAHGGESGGGGSGNTGMRDPEPGDPGTGVTGATGATPTMSPGTLTITSEFTISVTESVFVAHDYIVSLTLKPIVFNSVSISTTGGSSSGEITGNWADGFALALYLNIPSGITSFSIGTVTTVAAGGSATAALNNPSAGVYTLDLGIPTGATGADGTAGDNYLPDPSGLADGRYVLRMSAGAPSWEAE